MPSSRRCRACEVMPPLEDAAPLADVYAELAAVEALSREVDDLTAALRVRLSPEQFELVWSLRDAVERLGIAEDILRGRRPAVDTVRRTCGCADPD